MLLYKAKRALEKHELKIKNCRQIKIRSEKPEEHSVVKELKKTNISI